MPAASSGWLAQAAGMKVLIKGPVFNSILLFGKTLLEHLEWATVSQHSETWHIFNVYAYHTNGIQCNATSSNELRVMFPTCVAVFPRTRLHTRIAIGAS